jgi:hypothetical protein
MADQNDQSQMNVMVDSLLEQQSMFVMSRKKNHRGSRDDNFNSEYNYTITCKISNQMIQSDQYSNLELSIFIQNSLRKLYTIQVACKYS